MVLASEQLLGTLIQHSLDLVVLLSAMFERVGKESALTACIVTPCFGTQGGYFIINGSEKVLIAQERMANNHVYVFKKKQPAKYAYICECRYVFLTVCTSRPLPMIGLDVRSSPRPSIANALIHGCKCAVSLAAQESWSPGWGDEVG